MFSWRNAASLILTGALAACGGGGGGGGGTSGGGGVTPATPGNNMSSQSVQRADVQSTVAGAQAAREYSGNSTAPLARARSAMKAALLRAQRAGMFAHVAIPHPQASATSAPGCASGQTTSSVAGSNGSVVITLSNYYDLACTQIENTIVWTATQNGSVVSGPATITTYGATGALNETDMAQIEFVEDGLGNVTGFSALYTSMVVNGKNQGELGLGCSATSASAESCGVAVASDVYASSLEEGANVSFTATQGASGSTLTMLASEYQAGIDGLTISALQFPFWTISPGSAGTGSISMTGTSNGSTLSIAATDSTNGGAVAISGSLSGALTGTVTRTDTNAQVATFTLDANGNGTVTYGNGGSAAISNYNVQG